MCSIVLKTNIHVLYLWLFFSLSGYQICSAIEDMVSGGALNIPDSSLTASGYNIEPCCPNNDYSPRRARLNSKHIGSTWNNHKIPGCCMNGDPTWIQADLGE